MVPDIQQKILDLYLADITASAPKGTATHSRKSWLSIPSQLGKSSRRFQYTRIAKGATAKTYQESLNWLIHSGLALSCPGYAKTEPEALSGLHLYPVDVGLCTRILKLPSYQLLSGEESPPALHAQKPSSHSSLPKMAINSPTGTARIRQKSLSFSKNPESISP